MLLTDYQHLSGKSGVYALFSQIDNRAYVGSAINLYVRLSWHLRALQRGKHNNIHLQRFFVKHGVSALEFRVLEFTPPEALLTVEQKFINELSPEFNICRVAGSSLGRRHSADTRALIRSKKIGVVRNVGSKRTVQNRLNMIAAAKHRAIPAKARLSAVWRHNISKARLERNLAVGQNNPSAKLSEEDVRMIKTLLRDSSTTYTDIATSFGISKPAVSHIKAGRTWPHVLLGETKQPKPSESITANF